eukprot:gene10239-11934_t
MEWSSPGTQQSIDCTERRLAELLDYPVQLPEEINEQDKFYDIGYSYQSRVILSYNATLADMANHRPLIQQHFDRYSTLFSSIFQSPLHLHIVPTWL